jgi:hypothetical protein
VAVVYGIAVRFPPPSPHRALALAPPPHMAVGLQSNVFFYTGAVTSPSSKIRIWALWDPWAQNLGVMGPRGVPWAPRAPRALWVPWTLYEPLWTRAVGRWAGGRAVGRTCGRAVGRTGGRMCARGRRAGGLAGGQAGRQLWLWPVAGPRWRAPVTTDLLPYGCQLTLLIMA